ncbi:MAG: hypothetical protein ACTSVY_06595 [Candidatus Helarchaeota archaeon]
MNKNLEDLELIEKQRYLIPCKCRICKKGFQDIMLAQRHVFEEHPDRKKKNIIDNIVWNLEDDMKKYRILQDLEAKRNSILKKLNDDREIEKAIIPPLLKIRKKEYQLKSFIDSKTESRDKKPSDEEITALAKDLNKQLRNFLKNIKDVSMGKEIQKLLKKKKTTIESLEEDVNKYLIIKKVLQIIEK